MTNNLTSLETIQLLGLIARLNWLPISANAGFDGADIGADVPDDIAGEIMELLDMRAAHGLFAAMGNGGIAGDPQQIELHGVNDDGEPIAWILPINAQLDF